MRWVILFGLALALATGFVPAFPRLVVRTQAGTVLAAQPATPGCEISIRFTHSVARTPVLETLVVEGNRLKLRETLYQDFGAGLPSELGPGEEMSLEPDGVRITGMSRYFDHVRFHVGGIARHQVILGDRVLDLADLVGPGTQIDITVVNYGWLISLVKGVVPLWARR
ncbi:MAG: DUF1850 domain-containing protein [Firmicutes bacterium]|jgi:hypothetical protein|nr:DUF1850 domain-containing protein [Bacillota bacterium]